MESEEILSHGRHRVAKFTSPLANGQEIVEEIYFFGSYGDANVSFAKKIKRAFMSGHKDASMIYPDEWTAYRHHEISMVDGGEMITITLRDDDDTWYVISNVDTPSSKIITEVEEQIRRGLHGDFALGPLLVRMFKK